MAEVFGTVVNILTVLDLAIRATAYLRDVKHASSDRIRLREELRSTVYVLEMLKDRIEDSEDNAGDDSISLAPTAVASLMGDGGPIALFEKVLKEIIDKLEPQDRLRRVAKPFIWPFDKKEVTELLSVLERLKSHFNLVINNDLVGLAKLSHVKLDKIVQEVEVANSKALDEESKRIIDWISDIAYRPMHHDILETAEPGTARWFLDSDSFRQWADGEIDILWCPGIPGAGKTILSALVIDELEHCYSSKETICTFVYCRYNSRDQQTPVVLLSSILQQVLRHPATTSVPEVIKSLYKNGTRPRLSEVTQALQPLVAMFKAFHVVVDALDECAESEDEALSFISAVLSLGPSIKLMCTSRPSEIFSSYFQHAEKIEVSARSDDVEKFLDSQLRSQSTLARHVKRDPALKDEIVTAVTSRCDGMFLLAKLHIDALSRKLSPRAIRTALQTLPETIDATYDDAMQRIRNQAPDLVEIAETVLFWVVCARRLFHIVELCHAYATLELAEGNSLEDDDLPDAELLVSTCCGLVRIDEESQLVRMVHYTAQEYFYKYHVPAIISAHLNLARICIAYILQPACSIPETEEFSGHVSSLVVATPPDFSALYEGLNESFLSHVRKYPFLDYACEHWASHINHASDSELDASWPDVMKLLSDKAGLAVASVVVDTLHPLFSGRTHPAPSRSYYLSRLDAPRVLWWLLASEADDINAKDGRHFTPLMRAACLGLTENVKVLLHFGADTRPRSYYDDSALTFAALSGVASCVKALVDAGVDLNRTRYDDRTALHIAVRQGHVDMVKILIEAGADLKCRDIFRMTATDHAAARRNVEVLKLLIQAGAALSVHDALWTPLHWAAFQGTPETIKVLLDAGADVNCEAGAYGLPFDSDFQSATPLMLAAENTRNPQVIEVLLEAGGNVHLRDITGLTALHYAAWEGTPTTARLLLDTGADLEAVDREHRTPLMYAIDHGNIEVVQLLMAAGANVHARDHAGATALHAAAMKGHPEVVRMLLNAGASADIDVVDSHWGTPLIDAARNNNTEVVKILIEAGANLYATNKFGETALHRALHRALKRDDSGVTLGSARTLIDAGFNVNIPTPHRPLSHCLQCDNPESLELLLDSGAELEYCDDILPTPGYTPLHYVAKCGKQRCARVLIKRGVNVNAVSEENKTPLSLALAHGHVEIAQMLIQAGADIHTVVEDSEMLSRTLAAGEVGAAQLLLDAGATLEGFEPEDLIELKAELSKTEQEGPFGRKERIKEVRSVLARLSFRHSLGLLGM